MNLSDEEHYRVPAPGVPADVVRTPAELAAMSNRHTAKKTRSSRIMVNRERWRNLNAFTDDLLALAGPAAGSVWLALFRFARADGTVFASLPTLEAKTGQHRRTIQRAVSRLIELEALEKVQRGGGAVATSYRLKHPVKGGGRK